MYEIHIDLDGPAVYLNKNDEKNAEFDLISCVESALNELKRYSLHAIFFVIGENLEKDARYQKILSKAINEGHAIGNHSYSHPENFHSLESSLQVQEIELCHQTIAKKLNYKATHFRGPGYSTNEKIQSKLLELGYTYDCTPIPLLYSSFLDLFFRLHLKSAKRFPSVFRPKDIKFYIKFPHKMDELRIHPGIFFGIPKYSTYIYASYKRALSNKRILNKINPPFLFHAIDFSNTESDSSSIPALRINFKKRNQLNMSIMQEIQDRKTKMI